MRLSKFIERTPKVKVKQRRAMPAFSSIMAHASFVPMITVWGAALFGLAMMVLSPSAITRISTLTGLGAMGGFAQTVFAVIAAIFGGICAFLIAAALRRRVLRSDDGVNVVSAMASRRNRPINPATDLGVESLDAPIEEIPFGADEEGSDEEGSDASTAALITNQSDPEESAEEMAEEEPAFPPLLATKKPTLGELSMRGYEDEEPQEPADTSTDDDTPVFTRSDFKDALIETCEAAPAEHVEEAEADKPQALDLGEFAEVPGRDAVWVEEEAEEPAAEPETDQPTTPPPIFSVPMPPEGALERLRQKPPEELSLVEMVERFAGALHEHQQAERAHLPQNPPRRDAALAEALKALTLFTERGFDQAEPAHPATFQTTAANADDGELNQTERELREALVKLQSLRGAA